MNEPVCPKCGDLLVRCIRCGLEIHGELAFFFGSIDPGTGVNTVLARCYDCQLRFDRRIYGEHIELARPVRGAPWGGGTLPLPGFEEFYR